MTYEKNDPGGAIDELFPGRTGRTYVPSSGASDEVVELKTEFRTTLEELLGQLLVPARREGRGERGARELAKEADSSSSASFPIFWNPRISVLGTGLWD